MQIGRFKLTVLEFGRFRLDGGAMFGVVPRQLWERLHPPDEKNRIEMALRCLLIEADNRQILVDTGFGQGRSEKFRQIYEFRGSDNYLLEALSGSGTAPDRITDVILTHLHFDHCGGSTIDKEAEPIPAFPNARYYIQKRQLEHARARMQRDRASYLPMDWEPLIAGNQAEIVDGAWKLMDGLDTLTCDGHTPAMQLVRVSGGGETLLYAADLIPLASHISLPWIMAYDLYPVTTLEEKRCILEQAARENWTLLFEHDPFRVMGKVAVSDKGFVLTDG